jgi:hypothetical protein
MSTRTLNADLFIGGIFMETVNQENATNNEEVKTFT